MLQSMFMLMESINSSFSFSKLLGRLVFLFSSSGTMLKKGEKTDNCLDNGPNKD